VSPFTDFGLEPFSANPLPHAEIAEVTELLSGTLEGFEGD